MKDAPILFSTPMVCALLEGRKTQTRRALKLQPIPFAIDEAGTLCDVSLWHVDRQPWPRIWLGKDKSGVLTTQEVRFAVGQRLWVRETHTRFDKGSCDQHVWYRAGGNRTGNADRDAWLTRSYPELTGDEPWPHAEGPAGGAPYPVSSIHMPRWASRLTLIVTEVRVERLQAISHEDAAAEGLIAERTPFGGTLTNLSTGEARPLTRIRWQASPDHPLHGMERRAFQDLWESINGLGSWKANPFVAAVTFEVLRSNIDDLPVPVGAGAVA